jgi:hypothetical protein
LIGKFNQRGQQAGGIGGGSIERMVGEPIGGTALLVEFPEAVDIKSQWALLAGAGDAGAHDFKGRVEKNDSGRVSVEELTIGGLKKSASAKRKNRRTRETRENEIQVMVFDGAEAAFAPGGKQIGDGSVGMRNFGIEVDERAGKLKCEKAPERTLASPHETDEDQQRSWEISGH